jgi:threonine synthase
VYKCPTCGGIYDFKTFPAYTPGEIDLQEPGIWRYRHAFGLPESAPVVSLGEGNTPLVPDRLFDFDVFYKCEFLNPSGSFKDRGSSTIVSFLRDRSVVEAVEDSSGNAGASFAAYAARSGMKARIYIPDSASGPKRYQIEAYGSEVVRIMGSRSNAAEAVRKAADGGMAYASHAHLPFNLPGYATAAYEIYEQLGKRAPGTVIVPVGQGGFLLGMLRGFQSMAERGIILSVPRFVGVQARACAPIWATFAYGLDGLRLVAEAQTVAEGIRVRYPLRGDVVLNSVEANGGLFLAVDEEDILPARDLLARRGFYVEATSAVVVKAFEQVASQMPGPYVLVLTGAGLKGPAPSQA